MNPYKKKKKKKKKKNFKKQSGDNREGEEERKEINILVQRSLIKLRIKEFMWGFFHLPIFDLYGPIGVCVAVHHNTDLLRFRHTHT